MDIYDLIPEAKAQGRTLGWHFIAVDDLERLVMRDGTVISAESEGEQLPVIEHAEICSSGYHASERLADALPYAPDARALCLVELNDVVERQADKLCAKTRRILARIDVHPFIAEYADACARAVAEDGEIIDYAKVCAKYTMDIKDAIGRKDKAAVKVLVDQGAPVFDVPADPSIAQFDAFEALVFSAAASVLAMTP